jgi:hypothetical protein
MSFLKVLNCCSSEAGGTATQGFQDANGHTSEDGGEILGTKPMSRPVGMLCNCHGYNRSQQSSNNQLVKPDDPSCSQVPADKQKISKDDAPRADSRSTSLESKVEARCPNCTPITGDFGWVHMEYDTTPTDMCAKCSFMKEVLRNCVEDRNFPLGDGEKLRISWHSALSPLGTERRWQPSWSIGDWRSSAFDVFTLPGEPPILSAIFDSLLATSAKSDGMLP